MNHLDCRRDRQNRLPVLLIGRECRDAQTRPDALAAIESAVPHRLMKPLRRYSFGGEQLVESRVNDRTHALEEDVQVTVHFRIRTEPREPDPNWSSEESPHAAPPARVSCDRIVKA